MPRNGAGTFSLAEPPFVPNTPISSSAMNSDLSDIATSLTGSVAADGQTTITGALKGYIGSAGLPGYAFSNDTNTGMFRVSADVLGFAVGGVKIVEVGASGVTITGTLTVSTAGWINTVDIANKAVTYIKMQQPTAASRLLGSSAVAGKAITGAAASAGLIRLTVASTSDLTTGQTKTVVDVLGTTEANGTWIITVIDATHVDLQGSTFTNAYVSGGILGGSVSEISLGTGLSLSNAGVLSAPAFPAPSGFKNLSIKVASTTTVTVAADFVTTTDGTNYLTTALSGTINLGTNGAANALDAGTIAIDSWYFIWAIAKADGTTAGLASLSSTAPTLPTGYTFKARIGAVQTIHATATLYGTWQLGKIAQYVVGLAQTSTAVQMATGSAGTISTGPRDAIALARFVPTTAATIKLFTNTNNSASAVVEVAPNASYGGNASTTNPPPLMSTASSAQQSSNAQFVLESTNIYWASSGGAVYCLGWEDNL